MVRYRDADRPGLRGVRPGAWARIDLEGERWPRPDVLRCIAGWTLDAADVEITGRDDRAVHHTAAVLAEQWYWLRAAEDEASVLLDTAEAVSF